MMEKLNIVQSNTEPNKRDIWLKNGQFKKFGAKGWGTIGGGISSDTPVVSEVSGSELVPINDNGENKAVTVDALVKGGKEVYYIDATYKNDIATLTGKDMEMFIRFVDLKDVVLKLDGNLLHNFEGYIWYMLPYLEVKDGSVKQIVESYNAVTVADYKKGEYINIKVVGITLARTESGDGTKFLADNGDYKEISVPTKTSELTNDSGFVTAAAIPTVPTKTSELTNDSGFITADDVPSTDLTGYATQTWIQEQGYLTEHQDLSAYAKKTDIPDTSSFLTSVPEATADTVGGVKKVTIPSLTEDAALEDVISAYNDLVTQLIASGIAVASA